MDTKKIETLEASLSEAKTKAEAAGGSDEVLNTAVKDAEKALAEAKSNSQNEDPLKKEVEKLESGKFTKKDRLLHAKKKIDEQLLELDSEGQPSDEDKNKPVTVGMLEDIEKQKAQKTALKLAEDIDDENERTLVIYNLENVIRPSGDPKKDLATARAIVNNLKNTQIVEEFDRKRSGKDKPNIPGNPPKNNNDVFEPTPQERVFMDPPYNLKKEDIIKAREAERKE